MAARRRRSDKDGDFADEFANLNLPASDVGMVSWNGWHVGKKDHTEEFIP